MATDSVTCGDESPDSLADEDEEESTDSLADEDARGDEGATDSVTCEAGSTDSLADDATEDEAELDIQTWAWETWAWHGYGCCGCWIVFEGRCLVVAIVIVVLVFVL